MLLTAMRTASIIISSFNYAAFLRQAIDSALAQTHRPTQVIVVDDGSTDESPEIIRSYGDRLRAIFKPSSGQGSSLNAGFAQAKGDVIVFLDSDDVLEPHALSRATSILSDQQSKVHWPLRKIDSSGNLLDQFMPGAALSAGDLRQAVLDHGPRSDLYNWPPTSGNAWSRRFLQQVMPIPEASYRTCPDLYLSALAPLYGQIGVVEEPLSHWRVHGQNHTGRDRFCTRVNRYVRLWEDCCADLHRHARKLELQHDPKRWRQESWWHRLQRAAEKLCDLLPAGAPFVLVDDETWACAELDARIARPLVPHRGPPEDDAQAICELHVRAAEGARHLVFAWPAFWWMDYYSRFNDHLNHNCPCISRQEDFVVFELSAGGASHA